MFGQEWTITDAKKLFEQGLSDTQNIVPCKSSEQEVIIPESYDWREEYEDCVQSSPMVARNCSAAYVTNTIAVTEDKICM